MDAFTVFGLLAVTAMLVFYALEDRSKPLVHFGLRGGCALGSICGFLQGRMAIRDHRNYMGGRSDVALVAEVTDLIADSTHMSEMRPSDERANAHGRLPVLL
jgi:hypothetical protein